MYNIEEEEYFQPDLEGIASLSVTGPDELKLYKHYFCDFWPIGPFYQKHGYDRSWYAREGVPAEDTVYDTVAILVKWLWWVELFDHEEKAALCEDLLWQFVQRKSNGFISRLEQNAEDVKEQIKRIVKTIEKEDERGQALFGRIRTKRQEGKYKRLIMVAPLLRGEEILSSPLSYRTTYSVSSLVDDMPLPKSVISAIMSHAGRCKVIPFATRLLNYLSAFESPTPISQQSLCTMLGYRNPNQAVKFKLIVMNAGLIREISLYIREKESKKYLMSA